MISSKKDKDRQQREGEPQAAELPSRIFNRFFHGKSTNAGRREAQSISSWQEEKKIISASPEGAWEGVTDYGSRVY